MAPSDDFYPVAEYEELFGSLKLAKGKGHQRRTINGIRGVVVPASKQPWKLQRVYGNTVEHEEQLYSADEDDPGVESDEAENMYDDILAQKQSDYEKAVTGISVDELLQLVAADATKRGTIDESSHEEVAMAQPSSTRLRKPRRKGGICEIESDDEPASKAKVKAKAARPGSNGGGGGAPRTPARVTSRKPETDKSEVGSSKQKGRPSKP